MSTNLEKPVVFDESCAQEEIPPTQARMLEEQPSWQKRTHQATGGLERLDVLMWVLCFFIGTLCGTQFLP